ncbi:MAG: PD-(D/E)XK nuclease family protein [Methanosarcinales archaeon]|nr:PD-(D/E)XK nuclease family protein [Methanosarcinales archaeon]
MLRLYEIAKKARSGEEGAQNENLLTGIFVWVNERYPQFLLKIFEQSHYFGRIDEFNKLVSQFEKDDLQLDSIDSSLDGSAEFGRLDAVFKGKIFTLGLENKVVPIAKLKPNDLHNQIERYCQAMEKTELSSEWLILVITPDSESDAKKELGPFSKTFSDKVCWISWQKVWDISKDIIESPNISKDKKLVLGELKGGLELANLKLIKPKPNRCNTDKNPKNYRNKKPCSLINS